MLRKFFRGLRLTVLVPLVAVGVGLVDVEEPSALHAPKQHARPIRPQIKREGLDYVGLSVSTLADGSGLRVQAVVPGSLADASGLERGDVIVSVNGSRARTAGDLDAYITAVLGPEFNMVSLPLLVIDHRDPNVGPQPVNLALLS
jgi:membrane-associated protease RseP (regulator of RpoE activity)